jgi:hypothetical protein
MVKLLFLPQSLPRKALMKGSESGQDIFSDEDRIFLVNEKLFYFSVIYE